jgi:hypothetical protein
MPSLWSAPYTKMRETARLRKLLAELGTDNVKSEGTPDNGNQQPTPDIRHPKTRNQQQTKVHFITQVYTEYTPTLLKKVTNFPFTRRNVTNHGEFG